jgi:hypothetical protein
MGTSNSANWAMDALVFMSPEMAKSNAAIKNAHGAGG